VLRKRGGVSAWSERDPGANPFAGIAGCSYIRPPVLPGLRKPLAGWCSAAPVGGVDVPPKPGPSRDVAG